MGKYVNPPGQTKEQWLNSECYGEPLPEAPIADISELPPDLMLVCLVQNPMFSAALVVDNQRDWEAVMDPTDTRPKTFYLVDADKIPAVI